MLKKTIRRKAVHARVRKKVKGTTEMPRLSVFRSNKQISVQIIDDVRGVTLAAASSGQKDFVAKGPKCDLAKEVGKLIATKAQGVGVTKVVFDRGGYLYHGRVKSLAEGAREGGLVF
ncbi:MAG: hypothetical protein RIQ89_102 [Bacteroidota bacterium]|jgi:large subunit ribosomal protein L18